MDWALQREEQERPGKLCHGILRFAEGYGQASARVAKALQSRGVVFRTMLIAGSEFSVTLPRNGHVSHWLGGFSE